MKPLLLSLAITLLCVGTIHSKSFQQKPDSLKKKESIQITPNGYGSNPKALGNFGVVSKDTLAFQTNAGLSVFNTLRGNIPNANVSIDPTAISTGGIRSTGSLLVIDGIPFSQVIASHYNFNSFEYGNIYAFGSGNATTLYGTDGTSGAIFLESKNGRNFTKPTVELNSTTSFLWGDSQTGLSIWGAPPESETVTQWRFSNSIAFMQDFGKIDTRISYNYAALPGDSYRRDSKVHDHNFRINTGFDITPRLNARLILDHVLGSNAYESMYFLNGQATNYNSEISDKNLQGNLLLRYDVLNWLTLSSQAVFSKLSYDSKTDLTNLQDSYRDQQRTLFNLFTTAHHTIIPKLSFNATLGVQASAQKHEVESYANDMLLGSSYNEKSNIALVGGLELGFNDYLFGTFHYRADKISTTPYDDTYNNYSVATSFIFTEAFNINTKWFSFGKIRGSLGDADISTSSFPDDWITQNGLVTPAASSKKIYETGTDLAFFNNRVQLTTSYFQDKFNETYVNVSIPGSGYQSTYINLGSMKTSGWEVMLGVSSIRKSDFFINTKLTWTTSKTEIESINETPSVGTVNLGKLSPDWYGTILNQLNWKNFFTTFVISVQKGGSYLTLDRSGTFPPTYSIRDASETRLRDLSFGYRFTPGFLTKLHIKNAQIALSGRNLWLIHAEEKQENDGSFYSGSRKSANLSLTLSF